MTSCKIKSHCELMFKYLKYSWPNSIVFTAESNSVTNIKVLKSQWKSFKGIDVFCLLKLGILLLIDRASEIFLLYMLCLKPKLRLVKSSRVTRAWFEFTECWYQCEFLSFPLCSSVFSTNLLPVWPFYVSV